MLQAPETIEPALDLILISRHLERIGDHATNVAEDVIFILSARDVRHHGSDRRALVTVRNKTPCRADDDLELVGSPYGRYAEHYRQPHREDLRGPDCGRRHPRHRPQENHDRRRRPGAVHLRPGVHEHRGLQEQDHLHRRRQGHPDVSRIPDRTARRAQHLSRNRLPDPVRRAAQQAAARRLDPLHHHAHDGAREHQEVHGGVHLRRAPDGRVHQHRRRDVDLLSGQQADLQRRLAAASRFTG